jgi:hypothetical protein
LRRDVANKIEKLRRKACGCAFYFVKAAKAALPKTQNQKQPKVTETTHEKDNPCRNYRGHHY